MSINSKYYIITLLTFITVSCGYFWKQAPEPAKPLNSTEMLQNKHDRYYELLSTHRDSDGWVDSKNCDTLLWNGLLGATVFQDTNIDVAQSKPGQWERRPFEAHGTCYPKESRSSISRDMLLGMFWHAWTNQRADLIEDTWKFGEENNWIMGKGRFEGLDTVMNPNMWSLIAQMRYEFTGIDHEFRKIPVTISASCENFACHLGALQMLLDTKINGKTSKANISAMIEIAERNPKNPLFQYIKHKFTDGDYSKVVKMLLESSFYPADKLPSDLEVCEMWPMQREDDDPGLKPCPEGKINEHTGGDFLFLSYLLLGELNEGRHPGN